MNIQEKFPSNDTDPKKDDGRELDGPENGNDRPKTPDDEFEDLGTTEEETDDEKQQNTSASREELPEIDTEEDYQNEDNKPTDFDIDESTG